ncbi:Uncharacterised protein [Bordetella pertussis]|nr:Uncharacterised protein [Bordetella pertussis]
MSTRSRQSPLKYSKACRRAPHCSNSSSYSCSAWRGDSTAASTTVRVSARGNSRSATAVITPSVPSEPISSCLRS